MALPPTPPTRPDTAPAEKPQRDAIEARIAALRAELEAVADRPRQAVLQYEIGHLFERRIGNDALAVKEYLSAYNLDPTFRLPLFGLVRVFERRRSFRNLARLYEAEARSAQSAEEKASAIVDRASLLEDHLVEPATVRALLEEALAANPGSLAASLMLERRLYIEGNKTAAVGVVAERAIHADDPVMRSVLLTEVAWAREEAADLDGALGALREAAALPAGRLRVLEQLERVARKHDRPRELVEALESRAELAARLARGEGADAGSGAFSVKRFADSARAAGEAASSYRDAARIRASRLGDPAGAMQAYGLAIELRPDDVLLRLERASAAELAGDLEAAAADARHLLSLGVTGALAASCHFREGERALGADDRPGARAALAAALAADPSSAAAAAMLDELAADDGLSAERVARLTQRASDASVDARGRAMAALEAAQLAADSLGDADKARALFATATELATDKAEVLREARGAAVRLGDAAAARDAGAALLALALDEEERGSLLREQQLLLRGALGDEPGAEALLREALADPAAARWAPDAARVHAALTADPGTLSAAHERLAALAQDDETAAAHLAAAARASAKKGDDEAAMRLCRAALERAPSQKYAVALLEEILRSRGEADEVVALLRQAAAAQQGARAAETALLLAGAAAEAAGDARLAAQTYEEAADRDPTAVAPLHALEHLARIAGDAALLLRAREGLAEREAAAGAPGRAALDLADQYDLVAGKPELAEAALRSALADGTVGATAAAAALLLPQAGTDAELHASASQRLAREVADPGMKARLQRDQGGVQLGARELVAADALVEDVLVVTPTDRWARLAALRLATVDVARVGERGARLDALAAVLADGTAAQELQLAAVHARLATGDDGGAAAAAQTLAERAPDALVTALALAETVPLFAPEGADEMALVEHATERARALAALRAHAGTDATGSLTATLGRAQLDSGEVLDAYETLLSAVEADPLDLAAWESLRVAAREVEQWDDVVRACDVLVMSAEGVAKADLAEEAAALAMDQLGDDLGAMERLREALAVDVRRPVAYGRLHDLLAEQNDAAALAALVQRRIDGEDDDAELVKLFYEMARIKRSLGDREATITALENLLMLEPAHVGGLALMVETCVSLERFDAAVEALRGLAGADVPVGQRRLARLGAADFLEHKLHDVDGALTELSSLVAAGLADSAVHVRIADVAERAGRLDLVATALADAAAAAASGEKRASHERRAGKLHLEKRDDHAAAIEAYTRALIALPTDVDAAEALADLVAPPDALSIASGVVNALRSELGEDPTEPTLLRRLARAARLRGDRDLLRASLATLAATGQAEPGELDEHAGLAPPMHVPRGALDGAALARLRSPGDDGALATVLATIAEGLVEMDGLEPQRFGVGRGERISPKDASPLRDEVAANLRAFGLTLGDFYVGGDEPGTLAAMPRGSDPPAVVVGDGVTSPLTPSRRFTLGQAACALRFGVAPFLFHRVEEWPRLVHAAGIAAEAPLDGQAPPGVDELAKALRKGLPRKARGALPQQLALLRGADLEAAARAVRRTFLRAGLLVSGDLGVALELALGRTGGAPGRDVVRTSEDARDLLLYFLSDAAEAERRTLGLTT